MAFLSKYLNGYWYYYFQNGLKRKKISCRTKRKSEALEFVRQFQEKKKVAKCNDLNLSEFAKIYLKNITSLLTEKTFFEYSQHLKRFIKFASSEKLLKDIDWHFSMKYQRNLIDQDLKPITINDHIAKLKAFFQRAVEWNYIPENPFKQVKRIKFQHNEPAYFTEQQTSLFLRTLKSEFWQCFFTFAFLTGCRVSEIVYLKWSDLDFLNRKIRIGSEISTTKNKKIRYIPMHTVIYSILQEHKKTIKTDSQFVFSKRNGEVYTTLNISFVFRQHVRELGLPKELHLHSTRHTFASLLVKTGVPLYEISKLLGHSSIQMTEIYSHLAPENLHTSIEKLHLTI